VLAVRVDWAFVYAGRWGWEVQLVLEYCDKGSLRALLNKQGTFVYQGG
jgi:hypothetical protein